MYKSVTIRNFRRFKTLIASDLAKLNLVTGRNGSGKTALLEALFLNCGPGNASLIVSIANFRGEQTLTSRSEKFFRSIFHKLNPAEPATIRATWRDDRKSGEAKRNLTLAPIFSKQPSTVSSNIVETLNGVAFEYTSNVTKKMSAHIKWVETSANKIPLAVPTAPGQKFINLDIKNADVSDHIDGRFVIGSHHSIKEGLHTLLTQLTKDRKMDLVVDLLRSLDPKVRNVIALTEDGENIVYFDLGYDAMLPLFLEGQGVFNILNLSANLATMQAGVILIDEIESGLHFSLYKRVVKFILDAIRDKPIQVFITTHSDDLISAASAVCEEQEFEDICAFRFTEGEGADQVTRFDFGDLLSAREINLELR